MKVLKMKKLALAVGSLVVLGASSQALAVNLPIFNITPTAIGATNATFSANQIDGSSSELLHNTNPFSSSNVTTGYGYYVATGFDKPTGGPVLNSGLNNTPGYGLYLTFQLTATGAFGGPQTVTQLDFQVYADPGSNNIYTAANNTGPGPNQEATVTVNSPDILLGYGSLVPGTGVAGVDAQRGLFINSTENFFLCNGVNSATIGGTPASGTGISSPTGTGSTISCPGGQGTAFFSFPVPFYTLAFDAFNNTAQSISPAADGTVAVIANGPITFNNVPEPSTVALFGIAAAGLALSARRRKQ